MADDREDERDEAERSSAEDDGESSAKDEGESSAKDEGESSATDEGESSATDEGESSAKKGGESSAKKGGRASASDGGEERASSKRAEKRAEREPNAAVKRKRSVAKKKGVEASEPAEEVVAAKGATGGVTLGQERAARRTLAAGVSLAVLGLALVGTGPSEAGMAITLAGLLALIYGIHTFGRLGPEPAK